MEAIILAGGFGTRLRPLTYSVPKPLLPVMNTPMIVGIINSLPPEVDRVVLAVNYMAKAIRDHFAANDIGREVIVVVEDEPLGTGGAVKNCESQIRGKFFVINADVITKLDMVAYLAFHNNCGGIGVLALQEVEDPTRYGMVITDQNNSIQKFVEKPGENEIVTNWINAGTYILEPEVLEFITPEKKVSIEREVFPVILEKGLYGFKYVGLWKDAGTPGSYLDAHALMLEAEVAAGLAKTTHLLGEGTHLDSGVELGENVCIGSGVKIATGCRLSNCVVHDNATIGKDCILDGVVIGDRATIGNGCTLENDVLVEAGATVESGAQLSCGARVRQSKERQEN